MVICKEICSFATSCFIVVSHDKERSVQGRAYKAAKFLLQVFGHHSEESHLLISVTDQSLAGSERDVSWNQSINYAITL